MEEVVENPNIFIGEVAAVVFLSTLFSSAERWLRRKLRQSKDSIGQEIVDELFKEVTSLGYIGLVLFVASKTGFADLLAEQIFGSPPEGENLLAETFEEVHIMIFMLLTVLLLQGAAALLATRRLSSTWGDFERARPFGMSALSMESEFVRLGFLERVEKPGAPRGVELAHRRDFTVQHDNIFEVFQSPVDQLSRLVCWRALRHDFLFPSAAQRQHAAQLIDMPNPNFFSFEAYLERKMSEEALNVVQVDTTTWGITFLALLPATYFLRTLDFGAIEVVQFLLAWSLLASAWALTKQLDGEMRLLMPQLPKDARRILRLFHDGRASPLLDARAEVDTPCCSVPSLGALDGEPAPALEASPAWTAASSGGGGGAGAASGRPRDFPTYDPIVRLLAFWQAVLVTSLVVSLLSRSPSSPSEVALYVITWLEWPLMLFWAVPALLSRLTLRKGIERKDRRAIRQVSLQTKEGLLRQYVRLVQIAGLERRASHMQAGWTLPAKSGLWGRFRARKSFERGLAAYENLPASQKLDAWKIFLTWDANNDARTDEHELADILSSIGYSERAREAARNLINLVDYDGTRLLTWPKFKALSMLACQTRGREEIAQDINCLFSLVDEDLDGRITIFELAEWSRKSKIGMDHEEFALLLLQYFDRPKPCLSRRDFSTWIEAVVTS